MIRVSQLSFTYPGKTAPAVDGISFEVGRGEIFGFLGPSGAGKSTTQKILIGLLRGYRGEAEVMHQPLKTHTDDYFEKIGISFEFPNIYTKLTAMENLEFFGAMYRGETASPRSLLEMVGLGAVMHQRTEEFSKGMRMRLNSDVFG
jgi:fluoroquinolone transport system ATP-binding protein